MNRSAEWPDADRPGLLFGADYAPEQWNPDTWDEDVALMLEAGVNLVSVGVFSWASIETSPNVFSFDWLDKVLDLLLNNGISVALATATASPPPWLTHNHPEILPRQSDGSVLSPGGRQGFSVTHPTFLAYAKRLTAQIATRYRDHPAVVLWHLDNELGGHVPFDYSDASAAAFRAWLTRRYGTIEELNQAWMTSFWSQRYTCFDEILPPRLAPTYVNPTQQLDFSRYSSDAFLHYLRMLRDTVREIAPGIPVTTNFMATTRIKALDYFRWASEVDLVANDHYTIAACPERHIELAFSADLTRGIARGRPWLLMEHSTSAVNWQKRNVPKSCDEMLRNSLAHVARGADGLMFFQWRQSRGGAEKFHSAMLPQAGTDSSLWRAVKRLGAISRCLGVIAGSRVQARVAMVFSYEAWWASELDSHPAADFSYTERVMALYRCFWARGVTVDVVPADAPLGAYDLVVVPNLYLCSPEAADNLEDAARSGATLLVTYFSGVVDINDQFPAGPHPGLLRDLLGVEVEEFHPLREETVLTLHSDHFGRIEADFWAEKVTLRTATPVAHFDGDHPLSGGPAITVNSLGRGKVWYIATRLSAEATESVVTHLLIDASIECQQNRSPDLETVVRTRDDGASFTFIINHGTTPTRVEQSGQELISGSQLDGYLTVQPGQVAVVFRPASIHTQPLAIGRDL